MNPFQPRWTSFIPHSPTERQTVALLAHRLPNMQEPSEVFYGGAAGGGKSDWLLMGALQYVDVPGYAAILFRRTFTDLALPGALMSRSREWLTNTPASWQDQAKTWRFPSGATLTFAYMDHAGDELRYQSAEFQFVGFDELTQWADDSQYRYLFSRIRRPADGVLSQVPLRMCSASNPGGPGHLWVKERFGISGEKQPNRVFVPARLEDNEHLDQDTYRASLRRLHPTIAKQLEEGDWDVFEGAAFPEFHEAIHVVAPFSVPGHWRRFEFMDHGINNPTAWYVCAADEDGNLVVFDEYYSPGLVSAHAQEIIRRREAWYPEPPEWPGYSASEIVRETEDPGWSAWAAWDKQHSHPGPVVFAAFDVFNRTGGETKLGEPASVATEYAEHGIGLSKGNRDPKAGAARIRELLRVDPVRFRPPWAGEGEGSPQLFFTANCVRLIDQVKAAPLLPIDSGKLHAGEIVDPAWESPQGHSVAALRYGMLSWPGPSAPLPERNPDPRADRVQARLQRQDERRAQEVVEV